MAKESNISFSQKENQVEQQSGIVLNRMYVGDYLTSNLGHEVINMYQADDNNYYLYLNAYGSFAKKWQNKVKYMLLTKYHSKDCAEVIGKAINLSDLFDYEKDEGNTPNGDLEISPHQQEIIKIIKYGAVPIKQLFSDAERQNVYVTFKAEKVYKIAENKKILLHFVPQKNTTTKTRIKDNVVTTDDTIEIYLKNTKLALASLDQFFEQVSTPNNDSDYELIYTLFSNEYADFWANIDKIGIPDKSFNPREVSIFDICQIQNDENRFSFALKYFMEKYPELWRAFFEKHWNINLKENFKVDREVSALIEEKEREQYGDSGGRIDLTLSDNNTLIIIENKIKSDVNSKPSDAQNDTEITQLNRYYNYAKWIKDTKQKRKVYLFILAPNYNMPEIKGQLNKSYKKITYKMIYNYLTENKSVFQHDSNFKAFFEAMHRHTHDNVNDYLYFEMQEKLNRRIKEYNSKINNK